MQLREDEKLLLAIYRSLNGFGQARALELADDLRFIPRYTDKKIVIVNGKNANN